MQYSNTIMTTKQCNRDKPNFKTFIMKTQTIHKVQKKKTQLLLDKRNREKIYEYDKFDE